jgi:tetratricopeptide (TPR) repeat protein
MSDSDLKDTQPTPVTPDTQPTATVTETQPNPVPPNEKKNFPRWLPAVVVVVLILIGLLSGYGSGLGQRISAQNTAVVGQNLEQYRLGQQAMQAGQYDLAKQYYDQIIRTDPNFPGIKDAYAELLMHMQVSPTPLFTPTPLYTSTPDQRGADQLFKSAQNSINTQNWDEALATLDNLRKVDKTYHTAEVDGMYYIALRQRGVSKIVNTECTKINLEGGIYDLTLAERFVGTGRLDASAEALRTWARMYITGASFWDQDWAQAQNYFFQVKSALPNLTDSSCKSATERWRDATVHYADQLMAAGKYCEAESQLNDAFSIASPNNAPYYPTATANSIQCNGNPPPADTPAGGSETPTTGAETPTPTPTATLGS